MSCQVCSLKYLSYSEFNLTFLYVNEGYILWWTVKVHVIGIPRKILSASCFYESTRKWYLWQGKCKYSNNIETSVTTDYETNSIPKCLLPLAKQKQIFLTRYKNSKQIKYFWANFDLPI